MFYSFKFDLKSVKKCFLFAYVRKFYYLCRRMFKYKANINPRALHTISQKVFSIYKRAVLYIDTILRYTIPIVALVVIGALVIDYGFVLNARDIHLINKVYELGWWIYLSLFNYRLLCHWKDIQRKALSLTFFFGLLLYASAIPVFFDVSQATGVWPHIFAFLQNKYFIVTLLGLFSFIEFSKGVTLFVNRKTNPALLVVLCFSVTIAFGALLLLLPRSTMPEINLPLIDALFVSTSAVCVTGLSTVEVSQIFTLEGQIVIALLIQVGGLGIMTITSFFAIFFMDGMGLYSQFTLRDIVSSNASSLVSTLLYVLGFTLVVELAGAAWIWLSIHPMSGMSIEEEIFFAIFHSVSAFCNAGFSTLEGNLGNELLFTGHHSFYIAISCLIILGGLGFPVLINIKRLLSYHLSKLWRKIFRRGIGTQRFSHLLYVNTKIVLFTTTILILGGAVCIGILEWDGAFAHLTTSEKIIHSFFNSVVPRTAGFNSVSVGDFSRLTIILILVLMFIGGGSQSTAGGIKVNTLAVAFASIKSLAKGRQTTELFNREITYNSIRRTLVVICGSAMVVIFFFIALLISEPTIPTMDILFETISAFATVGSSTGITPLLNNVSKSLLVALMFIGRVGFVTVLMSIVRKEKRMGYALPKEDIIIN